MTQTHKASMDDAPSLSPECAIMKTPADAAQASLAERVAHLSARGGPAALNDDERRLMWDMARRFGRGRQVWHATSAQAEASLGLARQVLAEMERLGIADGVRTQSDDPIGFLARFYMREELSAAIAAMAKGYWVTFE